jgi:aspartate aminotransferase
MTHIVDQVSLGAIVQVRDRLLEQQAKGRKILRLESGDPSFDIPVHAREAMEKAWMEEASCDWNRIVDL